MGNLLTTGSLLAAFFAGGVALFAPCCIVFLLPSYMAAAVKNRRWRLLPLTLAFAAVRLAVRSIKEPDRERKGAGQTGWAAWDSNPEPTD